ncbi:MAG: hypothetical protein IJN90_07665 [Bacilli bacterium]|nr:hypothetical protein [Bacilli bacterium]
MKKVKNILFIFIALLTFVSVVDAANYEVIPDDFKEDAYDLEWNKKHEIVDEDVEFFSVLGIDDGAIAGGYRTYCEVSTGPSASAKDVKGLLDCYDAALIVKYDKDGNEVWVNALTDIDDEENEESIIFDMVIANDKIVALVQKETLDSEKISLVELSMSGEVLKVVDIADNQFFEFSAQVEYYNGNIYTAFNESVMVFNKNLELVKELETNFVYPVIKVDSTGIYIAGNDFDNIDLNVYKFDFKYNKVASKTIIDYNPEEEIISIEAMSDLEFFDDKIVLSAQELYGYNGRMVILDKSLNVIKEKVNENSFNYVLKESRDEIVTIELKYETCVLEPSSSIKDIRGFEELTIGNVALESDSDRCYVGNYLVKYDSDLNKIWEKEIDYDIYQIDSINNGVVLAGFDINENYYLYGEVEKYTYDDFRVEVLSDGNGTVKSSKITSPSGEVVEFTIEPKAGFQLKKVVVTTSNGEVVEFTENKFTMPSADVEIYAEFEKVVNNPNTGLDNPFMICGIALAGAGIGYCFLKKKKYI